MYIVDLFKKIYMYIYIIIHIYICIMIIFEVNKISFILQRDLFPCGSPQGVHIWVPHRGGTKSKTSWQGCVSWLCDVPHLGLKRSIYARVKTEYIYT
jgi:hypothetical protein